MAVLDGDATSGRRVSRAFFQTDGGSGSSGGIGYDISFSLALIGAGHLVGLSVGLAGLLGLVITWGVAVPWLTAIMPEPGVAFGAHVLGIWQHQVRFIGAGAIAVAAVWTLIKLARPVASGLDRHHHRRRARRSRRRVATATATLAGAWIGGLTLSCLALAAFVIFRFANEARAGARGGAAARPCRCPSSWSWDFLIAAVCGYMAGLLGSSNSPISSVGILTIVSCASLLVAAGGAVAGDRRKPLVAFTLIVTAVVFAVATISNDNLQDLKTGQLVGAAPWRQQIALLVGVVAGAVVIAPVLNLLAHAYGFAGAPGAGAKALAAPQATLISALAQGVIWHNLNWMMIGIGVGWSAWD